MVAKDFEEDSKKPPNRFINMYSTKLSISYESSSKWSLKNQIFRYIFSNLTRWWKRDIFSKSLSDACQKQYILKLKHCIYGISNAPQTCYNKVQSEGQRYKVSMHDPLLFTWYNSRKLCGILVSHVDNFLHCGTDDFLWMLKENRKRCFRSVHKEVVSI